MFCFTFKQNRIINEEFNFLSGGGGGVAERDPPFLNLNLNYYC